MSQPSIDVIAIGNAIVDVMAPSSDEAIAELGLVRGGMTLVDTDRAHALYEAMGPAREIRAFESRDWLRGRRISEPHEGTAVGISDNGRLRIRTDGATIIEALGSVALG